ncbi:glycosyl transferase [Ruminiclostridium herbifermentans]|uniref:Glycosyl transferase n=1 Tax=Ruminiclostridium herbifermentans TaxID=2488810 RepID=A0A4U7JLY1_9FIRM|nr:glycosyl transferase [Ruminiclostridium herbifermentans]QNU68222.1 glycosyl transferase [Ruminiclostridium herbifermentans]
MRYGYFDKKNKEYVVTRPDTPTPWINYIGSGNYGGIVSNTGGGYSFHKDPQNRRVTRYRYNSIPMDRPGRYIYIRNKDTGEYWNPGYQPVLKKIDSYSCRHGMGYTVLTGEYQGVIGEVTYFVPDDKNFEIWHVKLSNIRGVAQKLQVFAYSEFCFWDAIMDQQNVDWVQQINQGRYDDGIITYHPHHITDNAAFFATGEKVSSFDTNLETFIGKYRSESNPIAVEQGGCSNSISRRMNGVGAFCIDADLGPNEEREMVFILGFAEERKEIRQDIKDYLSPNNAKAALVRLKEYWENYIGKLCVDTPDEEMNLFVNVWNQYQCKTTFNWSRFVSLYQLGLGRGMGIRDSAQDSLGVMHTIPSEAKELIIKLLKCQFTDGRAYHLFFPLTGEGGQGDAPVKKYDWYSDDHLWLILAVNAYVKETGDFKFLNEPILYNDKTTSETVMKHLDRALEFTYNNRGPNNIALAGRADWNDTLNLDLGNGVAESVFTSMLFCRAVLEMLELCEYLKNNGFCSEDSAMYKEMSCEGVEPCSKFSDMYQEMRNAINESSWDGEWYKRAFDDYGNPLGSKENEYGKIFINSQSWAILGKVADVEKAEKCMESVDKYLNSKFGIVTMYPSYPEYDETKGGITTFPVGTKENGGIFLHTNPWMMISETLLGNGDKAFEYYSQILPGKRNDDAELYEVEPYVYCQNILGKENPQFGVGRNSWLSGTAAWNMVASSQHILGIRANYDCLIVEPCIPSNWEGFKAKRVFRGATYNIEVQNPNGVNSGIAKITVDGEEVTKIPVFEAGTTHTVIVLMK